jgi:hypothetical protein
LFLFGKVSLGVLEGQEARGDLGCQKFLLSSAAVFKFFNHHALLMFVVILSLGASDSFLLDLFEALVDQLLGLDLIGVVRLCGVLLSGGTAG